VQDCPVCGRSFDPVGFQVVIPELRRGFDRIECAQSARALATAGSAIATRPSTAIVPPIAATAARPSAVRVLSALGASAATLGVLAAGAAAATLLWWGALGTDSDRFPLVRAGAPPAAAGETVEARVVPGAAPGVGASNPRADVPRRILVALPSPRDAAPSAPEAGEPSEPTRHSSRNGGAQTRQSAGGKHDTGQDEAKGHPGLGNGHVKHGDTRDNHSPGHGHGKGSGQGKSNGQGQAKGKDKGQGHGRRKKH
jgi:hypothetical protein